MIKMNLPEKKCNSTHTIVFGVTKKVVQDIIGKEKLVCERYVEHKENDNDKTYHW
jgi:hypothetical protein